MPEYNTDMNLDFRIDRPLDPDAIAMLDRALGFVTTYRRRPSDQLQSASQEETRQDAKLILEIAADWAQWCTPQVSVVPSS